MDIGKQLTRVLINFLLVIFSVTCLYPIIWILYSGFKSEYEFAHSSLALPKNITFENFIEVFNRSDMINWVINSLYVAITSVLIVIVFSFILGYFLSRFKFWLRNFIQVYILLGMLIPVHALMIPMYVILRDWGLSDGRFTLVLPYVAFGLPIGVFLVQSYVGKIPRELEEAAAIDGSSFTRTLFSIMLPMVKPILITIGIIESFRNYNEFSFALVLINNKSLRTVPVGLTMFKSAEYINYPRLMAAIIVSMVPVLILYFTFSERIMNGMLQGAVKE